MKKAVLALLFMTLILGMLFGSAIVKADEGNSSGSDSGDDENTSLEASDNSEDDGLKTENESGDKGDRIREKIRNQSNVRKELSKTITTENGTTIKIERKVEIKNGEVKIKIKKTITFADGTKKVVEIEIKRNAEGVSREIQIEGENISIEGNLEVNDLFEENESELEAVLSDGNTTKIKILPERVRELVRERLRTRNISNLTLEEIKHKNIPRVVYNVETNQNGRFLGVFKLALKSETQIDPATGEILDVSRPWWAFLVSVTEEQTGEGENTTEDENSLITYEEALQIAQNSNCTAEGNLTDEHWYNTGTRTWWIDLDLESQGCNPTCVVSEETRTAEINWMCTGLVE